MLLLLDNYDSFTFNLVQYFEALGQVVRVVRNDELSADELLSLGPHAICLSPGPGHPRDAGVMPELIAKALGAVPMLGVCLGLQALLHHGGIEIAHAPLPMHGKVSEIEHAGDGLFEGLPHPLRVCRYHSLAARRDALDRARAVRCDAWTSDGLVMAASDPTSLWWGVQFHPEAILTQSGHELLANFLACARGAIQSG